MTQLQLKKKHEMQWVREITIEDPLQEQPLHLRWAAVLVLNVKCQVIKKFGGNRGCEPGRKGGQKGYERQGRKEREVEVLKGGEANVIGGIA